MTQPNSPPCRARWSLGSTGAVLALAAACVGARPPSSLPGPPPQSAHDRAQAKLSDLTLNAVFRLHPVEASGRGYPAAQDKWPDWTPSGIAAAQKKIIQLQSALTRVDPAKLSRGFAIDHNLLSQRLAYERFWYDELKPYRWDVTLWSQTIGEGFDRLTLPGGDATERATRLRALNRRLAALPAFLNAAKRQLKTPPRVFTEFVLASWPGMTDRIENGLAASFADHPKLLREFERLLPSATGAMKDFEEHLRDNLLPVSTDQWQLGSQQWRNKLKHSLHTDSRPEEIAAAALRDLELARFEMYDLALPLYKKKWPKDRRHLDLAGDARINHVVARVLGEAAKNHSTPASFVADVKNHAAEIRTFIQSSKFLQLPPADDAFVIEATPPHLDGWAVAFFQPAPALRPQAKKSYWISSVPQDSAADTESYLREYNHHALRALTIHEALPGHYVQSYFSSKSPTQSTVQRVFESGTMAEGWALWVEELMHRAGYQNDDPRFRLFSLKFRLRIFLNALIDQRFHTDTKTSPEDLEAWALDLMMQRGFQEEAEARRKIRRAKLSSTQLTTYFVGFNQMRRLHLDAEKKAGKAFDQPKFLLQLISYGTLPPQTLRKLLTDDKVL